MHLLNEWLHQDVVMQMIQLLYLQGREKKEPGGGGEQHPPDPASSPCHIQHLSWFTWIFDYLNFLEPCKLMFTRAWETLMRTNLLEGKFKHMPACLHRALAIWSWISPDNYRMSQELVWATIASGKRQQFHSYAIVVSCWNIFLIVNLIWVLIFFIFSIFQLINWEQHVFEYCDSKLVYGIKALPIN